MPAAPRGAAGLVSYLLELVAGKTLAAENQEKGQACANFLEAFPFSYGAEKLCREKLIKTFYKLITIKRHGDNWCHK